VLFVNCMLIRFYLLFFVRYQFCSLLLALDKKNGSLSYYHAYIVVVFMLTIDVINV